MAKFSDQHLLQKTGGIGVQGTEISTEQISKMPVTYKQGNKILV